MQAVRERDILADVAGIGEVLESNARRADEERRLPSGSLDAMREAGLLRLFVPRALGGLEIDPVTHVAIQEEVAARDSAAAWVLQVTSSSDWWCSRLPASTVDEIYAEGPDQIVAVSFGNPVEATPVRGGFRLSGQRPFASMVSDSSWIWLTALIVQDGQPLTVDGAPVTLAAFFPASDATIVDTWDTLGMRGTNSCDVLVEDLFVPEHRTFRIGIDHTPNERYSGPLYSVAAIATLASYAPAVSLGIARAAIDELVELASGKTPFASSTTLRERASAQSKVGRAEGLVRSARAYLYDRVSYAWDHALAGTVPTLDDKAEFLLASVQAQDAAVRATDMMYAAAGASAIYKRNRLEQLFRDVHVLRQHGFLSESRFETVGQVALGLDPDLGFIAL